MNTNLHFHTLVLDGVFSDGALATIRHRVQRLLVRHGLEPGDDATGPADPLADASPVLAGIVGASVQGRVALGPRAGARVRRLGNARDTAAVTSRGPRQAHLEGFDLHANVWLSANDRTGVERLCRYVLRPPFAQERLRRRGGGRVALELKRRAHALKYDKQGNIVATRRLQALPEGMNNLIATWQRGKPSSRSLHRRPRLRYRALISTRTIW